MENLTISGVTKPLFFGCWFLLLAASPFVFPMHGIPVWLSGVFLFFAVIIITQLRKFELSGNEIRMKNLLTGKTTTIPRQEIEYIAIADMPATIGARLGLMKRGRMATVMSRNKIKINIATGTTGHHKFILAEEFLHNQYAEFFKNKNA